MSTLASKVAALERHRGAVARELAANVRSWEVSESGAHIGLLLRGHPKVAAGIECGDACFDVHAAREHARQLIGKGLDLTTGPEYEVWSDWRMHWAGTSKTPDECPATASGHGGQYARLGQRILDMLEGQPDECKNCTGRALAETPPGHRYLLVGATGLGGRRYVHSLKCPCGESDNEVVALREDCTDCRGTGHNLRGKLPGVEWSPAVRRKVLDAYNERLRRHVARPHVPWTLLMVERYGADVSPDDGRATRVCPRGEHRSDLEPLTYPRYGGTVMRCQVDADGYIDEPRAWALLPAWRRGEIEHARQRREREAMRQRFEREQLRIRYGGVIVSQPMQVLRLDE